MAAHLGNAFAEAGLRTLLVEADMRKPELSRIFGIEGSKGLSLYLAGLVSPSPRIHETPIPNLSIAPSGPVPPNGAALLHSERLGTFLQAAVAGFLLTAVPNWTGRMPIQGWSLGGLVALLVAGRVAVAFSGLTGPGLAAVIDLSFPIALAAAIGREIVAGRNWRNLPMLGVLSVLGIANALTHLEAIGWTSTGALGLRLGIAVVSTVSACLDALVQAQEAATDDGVIDRLRRLFGLRTRTASPLRR